MSTLSISGLPLPVQNIYLPFLNRVVAPIGIKMLALSHTMMEGFFPGSKAFSTNNPGNIGTTRVGGTVGKFPTLQAGVQAQIDYFSRVLSGVHKAYPKAANSTLAEYIYKYAPPIENDTEKYISFVVKNFKKQGYLISRNTTLSEIAGIGSAASKIASTMVDEKKKNNPFNNTVLNYLHRLLWL